MFFFFCPYNERQQAQQNIGQKQPKEELFFKIFSLVFQRRKQKSNKLGATWVNDHINLIFVWTNSLNKERTRNNCTQHYNTLWHMKSYKPLKRYISLTAVTTSGAMCAFLPCNVIRLFKAGNIRLWLTLLSDPSVNTMSCLDLLNSQSSHQCFILG